MSDLYVKYLVCYDIVDNKRRKKFIDALEDLGLIRIQYSVFYGDLKPAEAKALVRSASTLLNSKEDKCFWFPCRIDIDQLKKCVGYANFKYEEPDGHGFI